jgi:hypothetical protein
VRRTIGVEPRVSDISLGPGIGVVLGALATLAAGAVLLVIGLVVGAVTRLQPGERRSARVLRCCAGALVCFVVGGMFFFFGGALGREALRRLDEWVLDIPVIGVALGLTTGIAIATARRAAAPTGAPATVERGAAVAVAASIAIKLAVYVLAGDANRMGPGLLVMCVGLAVGSAFIVVVAGSQALARNRRGGA